MKMKFRAIKVGRNYVEVRDNQSEKVYTVINKQGHLECGCHKGHNCVHEGFIMSLPEIDFWRVYDY